MSIPKLALNFAKTLTKVNDCANAIGPDNSVEFAVVAKQAARKSPYEEIEDAVSTVVEQLKAKQAKAKIGESRPTLFQSMRESELQQIPKFEDFVAVYKRDWSSSAILDTTNLQSGSWPELPATDADHGASLTPLVDILLTIQVTRRPEGGNAAPQLDQVFKVSTQNSLRMLCTSIYCLHDSTGQYTTIKICQCCNITNNNDLCHLEIFQRHCDTHTDTTSQHRSMSLTIDGVLVSDINTLFRDIKLSIGSQLVMVHQGWCNHTLEVTDARLVHDADDLCASRYPILSYQRDIHFQQCVSCSANSARYQCVNDPLVIQDPSYWCHECYIRTHYDTSGNLNVSPEFRVFPYYHDW